jgi:hypothetical protein
MRKTQLLAILFFSGIWGLSEAALGDALYAHHVPMASVFLAVIAFLVLAVAAPFVPRLGGATAIGLLAMLYKVLNVPFFGCHLAGIALLGLSWDLLGALARGHRSLPGPFAPNPAPDSSAHAAPVSGASSWWREALFGVVACYLGYLLFVLAMVFVFRSERWVQKGLAGGLHQVLVNGSVAAAGCAIFVPLGFRLGERLRGRASVPVLLGLRAGFAGAVVLTITVGIWGYGVVARILRG